MLGLYMIISCLSTMAHSNQPSLNHLFETLAPGEPYDRSLFKLTKAVTFNKTGGDATELAKVTLTFFESNDCGLGHIGDYTTQDAASFSISDDTPFGIVASALWDAGHDHAGITVADMNAVSSVAVVLKSTLNNTPQADFSGSICGTNPSFCCVPVDCTLNNECTSALGNQDFTLKTTTAIGDPADGGIIACKNTGVSPNLYNLVVPESDNSASIEWAGKGTTTGATSTTDGTTNTATIVACLTGPGGSVGCPQNLDVNTYAAGICDTYTTGPYNDWVLPAGGNVADTQVNCLYNNQLTIGGFINNNYWTSTENNSQSAFRKRFSNGDQNPILKDVSMAVRCTRTFVP